jgi:hypothetical protein
MWHWRPLWFGSFLDWLNNVVLSCCISLISLSWMLRFCVVVPFVFAWEYLYLCVFVLAWEYLYLSGGLICPFVVVTFVFAWSWSQMDELVSWLPKPILLLLEGGAAPGRRWLFTRTDNPQNICDHC